MELEIIHLSSPFSHQGLIPAEGLPPKGGGRARLGLIAARVDKPPYTDQGMLMNFQQSQRGREVTIEVPSRGRLLLLASKDSHSGVTDCRL